MKVVGLIHSNRHGFSAAQEWTVVVCRRRLHMRNITETNITSQPPHNARPVEHVSPPIPLAPPYHICKALFLRKTLRGAWPTHSVAELEAAFGHCCADWLPHCSQAHWSSPPWQPSHSFPAPQERLQGKRTT